MDSIKTVRKNILQYLKFLEKPREEFSGHPTCPYVSKEMKDNSMLIDTFYPQEEDFIEKIKEFNELCVSIISHTKHKDKCSNTPKVIH